ncbi:lytic transglycosylase F [Desulforhopalus vacuolatus]|uniref:transglycosylase SLT domain-containing protein n=1 Tax=Desulforhopalus vacuolatus TaxID=40414 RepID=UPI0019640819|nr:lytic transglycosylase F [Desulforhopalus vacuolatus]MBM9518577.1 lytic transglycosylase F [Desulforhopalus vacuolatus]
MALPNSSFAIFKGDTNIAKNDRINKKFTGDYSEMVKRKIIRVLVPYNRAFFFFDGARPKGISYENGVQFEKFINKREKTGTLKIKIVYIPTPRAKLLERLAGGHGDIAMGNIAITDGRRKIVDFSVPFAKNVNEIVVTGSSVATLQSPDDVSGMEIHVRKSSSYYENLMKLNLVLKKSGKKPVKIIAADEHLEDSDLLEMVSVGLIPAVVVDTHKAKLWKKVFPDIKLHTEAKIHSGDQIAWAVRKNSPELKGVIAEFAQGHKAGTLTGNVIINRYLKNTKYITNAAATAERKKFDKAVDYFKKYGDKYDFDYLMLVALAYQESTLDQSVRSAVGAVGVMQMMPATAGDKNVNIANIEKIEPNIHAGTKYLHFMADRYFPPEGNLDTLNRALFTFASYNAGPNRVAKLRAEAEKMGLDPNVWFDNVEVVAAKRIGRETVQYVSNIMKYYIAYKMLPGHFDQDDAEK